MIHSNPAHYVQTEQFSGPLDLLLQLIREHKMDICKIDIYTITHKYVEYLRTVPTPNLENAGDFIKMASLLIHIKSKTLLPSEEETEDNSDLKQNLVRLLVNYQKYQTVGQWLYKKNLLNRDTWSSNYTLEFKGTPTSKDIEIPKEKASFLLIQNYHKMQKASYLKPIHKTRKSLPSLIDHIKALMGHLIQGTQIRFSKLSAIKTHPYSRVLTFLSLLELAKLGFVSLFQRTVHADIDIKITKSLNEKALLVLNTEDKRWLSKKII